MHTPAVASPVRRQKSLEISVAALLAVSIVSIFWSMQRYPALLKKLHAGSTLSVKGAISFDALLKVTPEMPAPKRIERTAANWLWTNRFGMYFALPFGAAMMTMLALTNRPRRFQSAAANIVCGSLAGMPAGVCTNCATPIAQSLLVGGASTRLTLAAMISSPSFNPVVVAMVFVLFPFRLAIARVVVPVVLLLLLPLVVKEKQTSPLGISLDQERPAAGKRIVDFLKMFFRNLLRLTLMTLPWMLLAALLGATAVELIPAYGTHLSVSVFGIILVAIFGTLLPVPMAFDVGLAWVLYRAGVPVPYVATLLCTLGAVSLYSLLALAQQLGRAVPLKLAGATAALGTAVGLLMMAVPLR
jgi:uncharacterized membrane protein YraQ (UPF0718 family)